MILSTGLFLRQEFNKRGEFSVKLCNYNFFKDPTCIMTTFSFIGGGSRSTILFPFCVATFRSVYLQPASLRVKLFRGRKCSRTAVAAQFVLEKFKTCVVYITIKLLISHIQRSHDNCTTKMFCLEVVKQTVYSDLHRKLHGLICRNRLDFTKTVT